MMEDLPQNGDDMDMRNIRIPLRVGAYPPFHLRFAIYPAGNMLLLYTMYEV